MTTRRDYSSALRSALALSALAAYLAGCSSTPSSGEVGPSGAGRDDGGTVLRDGGSAVEASTAPVDSGTGRDTGGGGGGDSGPAAEGGGGDASGTGEAGGEGGCASCASPPANGLMWGSDFVPYGPHSIWNTPLPDVAHTYASDSAAIVAGQFPSTTNTYAQFTGEEPNEYDDSNNAYFASASDPVVTIDCSNPNSCGPNVPATIHIPANAHINGSNNDNIMFVVQPDGTEVDFYCWDVFDGHECEPSGWSSEGDGSWSDGDTIHGAWTTNCGNFFTGAGWDGATSPGDGAHALGYGAGGNCAGAGLLNASELASGVIRHALQILTACTQNAAVYPGYWEASGPNPCTGALPPIGYRLWYDVPCSQTQANAGLVPWEKAVLCALNVYGGFVTDNGSDSGAMQPGFGIRALGEVPSFEYATGDQWAQLSSQGWSSYAVGGDWSSSFPRWGVTGHADGNGNWTPPDVDLADHIHYLDPCVTEGTCP